MIRRWFVHDHRADFGVTKLCDLVELPRSTYYRFAAANLSDRYVNDAYLSNQIFDIWEASRRTYGSPRVWGQLRRNGVRVGMKRVARLMAECGLIGAHARKKWRRGRANMAPAPDLVERDLTAEVSDLKWVADTTEFKCVDGKLYLAGILDLHDRGAIRPDLTRRCTTLNPRPI